jgi:hypothetical protein
VRLLSETSVAATSLALGRAGIACLILSLALWGGLKIEQQRQGREAASRLLAVFTPGDEITATQAAAEAKAQQELVESSPYVRRDFLQTALQDATDAHRLKSREQGFLVSLSQVKSSEARSLYQSAILPAVSRSTEPEVLREGFALMAAWSIADTLDAGEKEKLASNLVAAILRSQNLRSNDADLIDALASGLEIIAPGVRPAAAEDLASKLVAQSLAEGKGNAAGAALPGVLTLEPMIGAAKAGALARQMADRMAQERDTPALRIISLELRGIEAQLDPAAAGEAAAKIAGRLVREGNPAALEPLASALSPLAGKIDAATAGELAHQIAPRLILEENFAVSSQLLSAWRAVAPKVEQPAPLAFLLTQRMSFPMDAHLLNHLVDALAMLKAAPGDYEKAGSTLLARMRSEPDPAALAELASAVAVLRGKLPREREEEAAGMVVTRLAAEGDPAAMRPMASAIDQLDEGVSQAKAGELASMLVARMRTEPNTESLLNLALGFTALAEHLEDADRDDDARAGHLAAPLLVRLLTESRPDALRTLAFSLAAVADGMTPAMFKMAAAKLSASMSVETDPAKLRALVAGLLALHYQAGDENFEKAATILTARMGLEADFATLRNLASSIHALKGRVPAGAVNQAASIVMDRILAARGAVEVDALARSLAMVAPDLDPAGAADLASRLAARAAAEPDQNLLRAYGEVLGSMPVGSLSAAEAQSLKPIFAIPNAPCQIVARVNSTDLAPLVRQIVNPVCYQDGWVETVATLDARLKLSIVHSASATAEGAEEDSDLTHLIAEDDDEASGTGADGEGTEIDFNKLSAAIDPFRPAEASLSIETAASSLLPMAGLLLVFLGWKKRNAHSRSFAPDPV